MTPPKLVLDDTGQPMVMQDGDVPQYLGRTFAIAGRRNTPKLYLPLHAVTETIEVIAPALAEFEPELVLMTYRCGRREGIAQVTLGALLGVHPT